MGFLFPDDFARNQQSPGVIKRHGPIITHHFVRTHLPLLLPADKLFSFQLSDAYNKLQVTTI
jgi:hypothetical protein